jgi:CubicO group peptidase (beta-lactamase class C family)
MTPDSVFWIASMTKPVTCAAAMQIELAPGNWTDCLTRVLISPTGERADKQ